MTQPPLSRQVRSLEDELGLMLFDRSTRSVRLTPAGSAMLPKAQQALGAMAGTASHARLLADGMEAKSASASRRAPATASFRASSPPSPARCQIWN